MHVLDSKLQGLIWNKKRVGLEELRSINNHINWTGLN